MSGGRESITVVNQPVFYSSLNVSTNTVSVNEAIGHSRTMQQNITDTGPSPVYWFSRPAIALDPKIASRVETAMFLGFRYTMTKSAIWVSPTHAMMETPAKVDQKIEPSCFGALVPAT